MQIWHYSINHWQITVARGTDKTSIPHFKHQTTLLSWITRPRLSFGCICINASTCPLINYISGCILTPCICKWWFLKLPGCITTRCDWYFIDSMVVGVCKNMMLLFENKLSYMTWVAHAQHGGREIFSLDHHHPKFTLLATLCPCNSRIFVKDISKNLCKPCADFEHTMNC